MPEFITVINLAFAEGSQSDPSTNKEAWAGIIAKTKSIAGLSGLHIGQQVEQPSRWTVLARWSSPTDLDAFVKSADYQPWLDSISAQTAVQPLLIAIFANGDVSGAVEAPVTQVVVAFGADDGFAAGPFADLLTLFDGKKLPGYKGCAHGETNIPALEYVPHPGKGAAGLVGWESVEAHKAAIGADSQVADAVAATKSGCKSQDVVHVKFKTI